MSELHADELVEILYIIERDIECNPIDLIIHRAMQTGVGVILLDQFIQQIASLKVARLIGEFDRRSSRRVLEISDYRPKMIPVVRHVIQEYAEQKRLSQDNIVDLSWAYVDYLLAIFANMPTRSFGQTFKQIDALLAASCAKMMKPIAFLTHSSDAYDWIIRLASSPDEYRAERIAYLDAVSPDTVSRCADQFRSKVTRQIGQSVDIELKSGGSGLDLTNDNRSFWAWRAVRIVGIEREIEKVWGGVCVERAPET